MCTVLVVGDHFCIPASICCLAFACLRFAWLQEGEKQCYMLTEKQKVLVELTR